MRQSAFLPSDFGDAAARVARVRLAAARTLAPEALAALRGQNAALPASEARAANLATLARGGAAAVVTGQQVGLFGGPLYTLYKAATAVVAARGLAAESGVPCVPIFWLQTEDHDFAEIAGCHVGEALLSLPIDARRCSVAHRVLGAEITPLLAVLAEALGALPHAAEVQARLAAAYRPGARLGEAFAQLLAGLFDELVFLDPRDARLAALAAPVTRRAIADGADIERLLRARGDALRAAGFDEQVRPRPGFTLAFFHPDGADGPRWRVELGAHVDGEPLQLSTSALLRPLVQDTLLPTAAYVGGPAEVGYFAQLPPLYDHFGLPLPLVIPRARFRLVPPAARRLLDQLGLRPEEAEEPELLARLARADADTPQPAWLAELEARLDAYAARQDDKPLLADVARARASARHALARLERRHQHHAAQRQETLAARVARLQGWLFPGGAPQERVHGIPWYAAQLGPRALVDRVVAAVDILDPRIKDLAW